MGKKRTWKRAAAGLMAAFTVMVSVLSPLPVYAQETETDAYVQETEMPVQEAEMAVYAQEAETEEKPPFYEDVKELLDEDETVKAEDYELETGSPFDPAQDFSGIDIPEGGKVRVTFEEAKNGAGENFANDHADVYKAVYYVEPLMTDHPKYQISRNLIVKEAAVGIGEAVLDGMDTDTVAALPEETGDGGAQAGDTPEDAVFGEPVSETTVDTQAIPAEPETASPETEAGETDWTEEAQTEPGMTEDVEPEIWESLDEERLDEDLEVSGGQETYDEESGLALHDVLEQGAAAGIDFASLDLNETVSFVVMSASGTETVDITAVAAYNYADYGLGTFQTHKYKVVFGDITTTAYCVQPSKGGPSDGKYTVTRLKDGKALAKVCYYGTKAAGDEGFFAEKHPDFNEGKRFIITHIAAAYANGSSDAFTGTNDTGRSLAMELYNYCMDQPAIPEVDMEFSNADVTAYVDGNSQRTEEITFKADELQSITMDLPAGVKLHNVTTGKTSKAGASVELHGGTKFYLTAPLTQVTDVGASWSSKMKGSVTKDYSAYKITTGSSTQDLALVFGEGVNKEKYVNFSVKWIEQAGVAITKRDSVAGTGLAGSVYGIYADEACSSLIVQMPATDASGSSSATFLKTQDTVYLKEITAPNGYVIDINAHGVTVIGGSTVQADVTNKEQLGQITVYKEGQVLTGASANGEGVAFQYETRKQAGAVYDVYAGADIYTAYGELVYHSGELVKAGLTTDGNGAVVLTDLHLGTYRIREVQAPKNFYNSGEEKTVTLSYAGQTAETAFAETTFTNERQRASVSVVKKDSDTSNPLDGGIFGLYAGSDILNADGQTVAAKGTLIEKVVTGEDGTAVFRCDLPVGFAYEVKEMQAPAGYLRNTEDVYTFQFAYTNDSEATVSFSHVFVNDRVRARISLVKRDAETGETPQGDAVLGKAVYGLYAREDIVHPDGKTGVLYKAGTQVATLTTDDNGEASVGDLYLGKYYVKEITPSVGYLLDEAEHDLSCDYEGDLVAVVERDAASPEQVIKQPFQVIKAANNGKTDADLLSGVGFTAYLVSSLQAKGDGSYDFASAVPAVIGENGATEIFTDSKGHAVSIAIPYGTYLVRETTTPHNFKPVEDFLVRITENHPTEPQVWRVLLDDEFEAKLKIVKQDDETKKPVLAAGTEFKVYDLDNGKYVEQVTTYPVTVTHTSYFTDSEGYLILPQNLPAGNYRIEEVTAPEGYTVGQAVDVAVDSDTMYQVDPASGDAIIEVVYENHPVKGKLRVVKKGEVLAGYGKHFEYEVQPLAGAVFAVTAAEDIFTADYQKDADGNRICEYRKGELVAELTTGEDGEAVLADLPLGRYSVAETKAPEGYVRNGEAQEVLFEYAGQETAVVEQTAEFADERQRVQVKAIKKDAENEAPLAGAGFGLYAKEDITAGGKVIVPADTLLAEAESGEDGCAVFDADLPFGVYYIREVKAPAGYLSNAETKEITASYQGQEIIVEEFAAEFTDQPTVTEFTKSDLTTGVELDGASLTVLDKDGNVVDAWTSVRDQPHVIKRLHVGETYTLREEFAPYGYLRAEEVKFTVEDTEEVQKVEMKDAVPTALLIISKNGEFLDKVTLLDDAKGMLSHLFGYVTGSLPEVTFEVYAAEDIKAADGTSADYYKADELVGTITTDAGGIAQLGGLPVGKYYVKEAETAHGFVLDGEPRYVDLSYRDQDTPVVTYSEAWQNARQKARVHILKKEKNGSRVLAGGVFGLYAAEDIRSAGGDVLMKKDTLIEQRTTDDKGEISFLADLPVDGSFYIREIKAPDGFVASGEKQEFVFEYAGEEQEEKVFEFVFEDEATTVELTKTDLTTGKELPGAHLRVIKENGDLVDEWVSGEKPHVIRELTVGETYELTETKPADGYVTAESIVFTVENTAEIQKHRMEDDVTKVSISKTDITGTQEVPGAKLTILDENDQVVGSWTSKKKPHYVEKLPVGRYTLREERAPEGYVLTEDVVFTVSDTGEIQSVQMKDDTAKGKVILNKTDEETGRPLAGVEFELRDGKGRVLETLKTDAAGHAESGLYEIASYKGGVYDKTLCYYLMETKALDGYVPDDMEHEIVFKYAGQSTPVIEVKLDLTNKPSGEPVPVSGAPKTGDQTPVVLMLMLMAGAAGVAVLLLVIKRKRA